MQKCFRFHLILFSFCSLPFFTHHAFGQNNQDSLISFVHNDLTLLYPASWHRDARGSSLMLYPEKKDGHYPGDFTVSFLSEAVSSGSDLKSYTDHHVNSAVSIWKRYGETLEVEEKDPLHIAGLPAYKVICQQQPANQVRIKYLFIKGSRAFRLDYTGPSDTYTRYLPQVENMIQSIQFEQ